MAGRAPAAILLAWLCAAGCGGDDSKDKLLHRLMVLAKLTPETLEFGRVALGRTRTLDLQLANAGAAPLTVDGIEIAGMSPDAKAELRATIGTALDGGVGPTSVTLPASAKIDLAVTFTPIHESELQAILRIRTGTASTPIEAPIHAIGYVVREPFIQALPAVLDFGPVHLGTSARASVTLKNLGLRTGTVSAVAHETRPGVPDVRAAPRPLDLDDPIPLPIILKPGGSIVLPATFSPTVQGALHEYLVFTVSGTTSRTHLALTGIGTPPFGEVDCTPLPLDFGSVAAGASLNRRLTCTATNGVARFTGVQLGANAAGFRIVSAPPPIDLVFGSKVEIVVAYDAMGSPRSDRGDFYVNYQGARGPSQLRVPLVAGVITPGAISAGIAVTLRWDTDRTDLDLHLVRAGSMPFDQFGGDCYFEHPTPTWGPGVTPILDRDVTDGYGPETISLASPAAGGRYEVYAQYFTQIEGTGVSFAHVEVRFDGRMVGSVSLPLICHELWHAGTIVWNGAASTFTATSDAVQRPEGQCSH